jgi:hypothetical protein
VNVAAKFQTSPALQVDSSVGNVAAFTELRGSPWRIIDLIRGNILATRSSHFLCEANLTAASERGAHLSTSPVNVVSGIDSAIRRGENDYVKAGPEARMN